LRAGGALEEAREGVAGLVTMDRALVLGLRRLVAFAFAMRLWAFVRARFVSVGGALAVSLLAVMRTLILRVTLAMLLVTFAVLLLALTALLVTLAMLRLAFAVLLTVAVLRMARLAVATLLLAVRAMFAVRLALAVAVARAFALRGPVFAMLGRSLRCRD